MARRETTARVVKGHPVTALASQQSVPAGLPHAEARYPGHETLAATLESFGPGDQADAYRSSDEIAMVRRATEVLGLDHVAHWMQSRIPSLGNRTPYALIATKAGRAQVALVLLKIEHGVY